MFSEIKRNDKKLQMDIIENKTYLFSDFGHGDIDFNITSSCELIFLSKDVTNTTRVNVRIVNPNIDVLIRTISLTRARENFFNEVSIVHEAVNTNCDYKFLGFAFNESNLHIRAKNKILKGMKGSATHQSLKVITDNNAKAQAEPGLMIDEFDVVASHGNSIGQIDPRTVYYLQSKGMTRKHAQWMIVKGNVEDILKNVSKQTSDQIVAILDEIIGGTHG